MELPSVTRVLFFCTGRSARSQMAEGSEADRTRGFRKGRDERRQRITLFLPADRLAR